jgi:hypothetical protein
MKIHFTWKAIFYEEKFAVVSTKREIIFVKKLFIMTSFVNLFLPAAYDSIALEASVWSPFRLIVSPFEALWNFRAAQNSRLLGIDWSTLLVPQAKAGKAFLGPWWVT